MKAKILFKLNQIARYRLFSGMKDSSIAALVGLSQSGLSRIISLPEYQEIEHQLLEGGITKLDEAVAGKAEEMKAAFKVGTPAAMRTLIEVVTQRRDLRAAVAASIEVLDRDPDRTFVKASRSEAAAMAHAVPASVLANALSQGAAVASSMATSAKTKTGVPVIQPPDKNSN